MRDILFSWAFVVLIGTVIFYSASAFIFWQFSPGDWPQGGRISCAVSVLLLILGSTFLALKKLSDDA